LATAGRGCFNSVVRDSSTDLNLQTDAYLKKSDPLKAHY
jgi:hypothetical protein